MKRSDDRILTTHTGSLARAPEVREMLRAQNAHEAVDPEAFQRACEQAVAGVVARQVEIGLDMINDGEQSKTGFAQYVRDRLDGFDGDPVERVICLEDREFPETSRGVQLQQPCTGPLAWKDFEATERDIANLKAATKGVDVAEVFMTSVSPGTFLNNNPNQYYATREEYLAAIVDVMQREYRAIADAGFLLQIDSPDLTQRSFNFPDTPEAEWLGIVEENVDAINAATRDIPRDRKRVHVCWGAGEGPHNYDTELPAIVGQLMRLDVAAVSFVNANGRHEHEWKVWREVDLPEEMVIIPGVIDSTTNIIEHPATVAERLVRFASVVGRERVIGGVDCGFGTGAEMRQVDPKVAWAKLRSLTEGAALASSELWPA